MNRNNVLPFRMKGRTVPFDMKRNEGRQIFGARIRPNIAIKDNSSLDETLSQFRLETEKRPVNPVNPV